MKIVDPSAEIIDFVDPTEILLKLELCGRVSHQSEFSHNFEGAENFVRRLIKRGHESVLEHVSLTFLIVCDRAIMAELTRHRHASFTVESTRYVKYDELTFINQFSNDTVGEFIQEELMLTAESIYRDWIKNHGAKPEQARAVLPLCLATKLYMTANLREWRHILKLRTDKAAHPQMRFIMKQILDIFRKKLPVIVEDIGD